MNKNAILDEQLKTGKGRKEEKGKEEEEKVVKKVKTELETNILD